MTDTEFQDENKLIAERRAKLAAIRKQRQAFPNTFRRDSYAQDLQERFGEESKGALESLNHGVTTVISGR